MSEKVPPTSRSIVTTITTTLLKNSASCSYSTPYTGWWPASMQVEVFITCSAGLLLAGMPYHSTKLALPKTRKSS